MRLIVHDAAQGLGRAVAAAARAAGHEVLALTSTPGASPTLDGGPLTAIPSDPSRGEPDEAALTRWVAERDDAGAWDTLVLEPGAGAVRAEFREAAVELPALGLETEALLGLFGAAASEPLVLARVLAPLLGASPRIAVVAGWLGRSSAKLQQHGGEVARAQALRMLARKLAFEAAPDGATAAVLRIAARTHDASTAHTVLQAALALGPAEHGETVDITANPAGSAG